MKQGIRRAATVSILMTIALAVFLAGREADAKKKPKICDDLAGGVGYFHYFQSNVQMLERLQPGAAVQVDKMFGQALGQLAEESFASSADLNQPPYSIAPDNAVKETLGGYSVKFDDSIAEKAGEGGLGFVIEVYFYTAPRGGGDPTSAKREDDIDLNGADGKVSVFNYVFIGAQLATAGKGKVMDKSTESMYGYKEWFFKKYPKARMGKAPEADMKSMATYRAFLKDSIEDTLLKMRAYKKLGECKD